MAYSRNVQTLQLLPTFLLMSLREAAPHFLDHNFLFFSGSSQQDLQFYRLLMVVACKKRNIETFIFVEFHPLVHSNETMLFKNTHTHNLCHVPNQNSHGDANYWKLHLCFFSRKKRGSKIWSSMVFGQTLCEWRVNRWVGRLLQRRSEAGIQAHDPSGKMGSEDAGCTESSLLEYSECWCYYAICLYHQCLFQSQQIVDTIGTSVVFFILMLLIWCKLLGGVLQYPVVQKKKGTMRGGNVVMTKNWDSLKCDTTIADRRMLVYNVYTWYLEYNRWFLHFEIDASSNSSVQAIGIGVSSWQEQGTKWRGGAMLR